MSRLYLAAAVVALCPAVLLGQTKEQTPPPEAPSTGTTTVVTRSTAAGEVTAHGATVTPQLLSEQNDPKLVGSPAWWRTHATADGKPVNAVEKQ